MRREDIENAILATFLSINDLEDNIEEVYKINLNIFSSPFREKVADKINSVDDEAYGFLSYEIEDGCKGTSYEYEYQEINGQLSLGLKFSKLYHDKLIKDDEVNELC